MFRALRIAPVRLPWFRLLVAGWLFLSGWSARALTTPEVLASFRGGPAVPESRLIRHPDGNLYGTTQHGGRARSGTLFRLTPAGEYVTLVDFGLEEIGFRGIRPSGDLTLGPDGSIYGTTQTAMGKSAGVVFKFTVNGTLTTFADLGNTFGFHSTRPNGSLVFGIDGKLYGLARPDSPGGLSTFFRITPAGVVEVVDLDNEVPATTGGLLRTADGSFLATSDEASSIWRVVSFGLAGPWVNFPGQNGAEPRGIKPTGGLVTGPDGAYYGVTEAGGLHGHGTVFRLAQDGTVTTLVDFTGLDGAAPGSKPRGALTLGADGQLHGSTSEGGAGGFGTIFRVATNGTFASRLAFTGVAETGSGQGPVAPLHAEADGTLFGSTRGGPYGFAGSIFRLATDGTLTTLRRFTSFPNGFAGYDPVGTLVSGSDGWLYGVSRQGGFLYGAIYRVSLEGEIQPLIDFSGVDGPNRGASPGAGLVRGPDGHFYGTTSRGGVSDGGTVFRITEAGVLTTLADFPAGESPKKAVTFGPDGRLYGTTSAGGSAGRGSVFRLNAAGALETVASFTDTVPAGTSSLEPNRLLSAQDGHLYGTLYYGGANGTGRVFKLTTGGELTTVYDFPSLGASGQAAYPAAGLVQMSDGRLIGMTMRGGTNDLGTTYVLSAAGALESVGSMNTTLTGAYPTSEWAVTSYGSLGHSRTMVFRGEQYPVYVAKLARAGQLDFGQATGGLVEGADGNVYGQATGGVFGTEGGIYRVRYAYRSSVTTQGVGAIGTFSAELHGQVQMIARNSTAVYFRLGTSPGNLDKGTLVQTITGTAGIPQAVVGLATGLLADTTYYYQILADVNDSYGPTSGELLTFRTNPRGAPVVTTGAATDITQTSVKLHGILERRGSTAYPRFEYGTTTAYGTKGYLDSYVDVQAPPTAVVSTLTGLMPGTTYHYRLVARHDFYAQGHDNSEGADATFTTLVGPPSAVTLSPAPLRATTATLRGAAMAFGPDATVRFRYGTPGVLERSTDPVALPNTAEPVGVTADVVGLTLGGSYACQLEVNSPRGTVLGEVVAFTTAPIFAVDDTAFVSAAPTIIPVLSNDEGDGLTVVALAGPHAAHAVIDGNGTSIVFTPDPATAGSGAPTETLTYTIRNGAGLESTAEVRVHSFGSARGTYSNVPYGGQRDSIALLLGPGGAGTGYVSFGYERLYFSVQFDLSGHAMLTLPRVGEPALLVDLRLNGEDGTLAVIMTESGEAEPATQFSLTSTGPLERNVHRSWRAGFIEAEPGVAGLPTGLGFFRVRMDAAKRARFIGWLPDGTPFSAGSVLVAPDPVTGEGWRYPLVVRPYGKNAGGSAGEVVGTIQVADDFGGLRFHGALSWRRDPGVGGLFPAGFAGRTIWQATEMHTSDGSLSKPVYRKILGLALKLSGGGLHQPWIVPVNVKRDGDHRSGMTEQLGLRITVWCDDATVRGSFLHPTTGERVRFVGGIVVQESAGGGSFVVPSLGDTGRFEFYVTGY